MMNNDAVIWLKSRLISVNIHAHTRWSVASLNTPPSSAAAAGIASCSGAKRSCCPRVSTSDAISCCRFSKSLAYTSCLSPLPPVVVVVSLWRALTSGDTRGESRRLTSADVRTTSQRSVERGDQRLRDEAVTTGDEEPRGLVAPETNGDDDDDARDDELVTSP